MSRRNRRRSNLASPAPAASDSLSKSAPIEPPSARTRLLVAASILLGAVLWALSGNDLPARHWVIVLALVAVSLVPPVTTTLTKWFDRVRRPSQRAVEWTGLIVGVVATAYLTMTAFLQERPLAPRMLDECSYAISTQLLAHGHLWLPQHPLADFFDSFFVVVRPVYSSIYFPGTALANAPGVWFGWPTWIVPVVLTGISIALVYRVVTALTADGVFGLLAAFWMLSLMPVRALSVMVMSQVVMLALGMLILWAWLRWQTAQRRWAWAIAIGALAGWAAITRPVDAIAFAAPVGIAMMLGLRGRPVREWLVTAAAILGGAAPFLALQVAHNAGVTGNPLRTPYTDYLEREQPGAQFGVRRYDPNWQPASQSWQIKAYYDWCRPFLIHHQPDNFLDAWFSAQDMGHGNMQPPHVLTIADNTLPAHALLLFLPAGVIVLAADRRRLVLGGALLLFLVLYALNPFFLPHYLVVVTPAMILLIVVGVDAVARAAGGRAAEFVRVAGTIAILAFCLLSLWEVRWLLAPPGTRPQADGFQESAPQSMVLTNINSHVEPPAIILFGRPPDVWTNMVYNTDAASPDDAPIIRAHDLDERDAELVDYYGERQPERVVYQFDWKRRALRRLGVAGELRNMLHGGAGGGAGGGQGRQ